MHVQTKHKMRHGKKFNHLGRTDSHRKAMLANMASSLIQHKRITTTIAKAKALRTYIEPLLTKSKNDTTHSRRTVFSYLKDKETLTILFREVAEKIANRPGGYTRIVKLGNRLGDNAEMALIELVDFNTVYGNDTAAAEKKSTRRRGSGKGKKSEASTPVAIEAKDEEAATITEEVAVVEEPTAEEAVSTEAVSTDEASTEETPSAEDPKEDKQV